MRFWPFRANTDKRDNSLNRRREFLCLLAAFSLLTLGVSGAFAKSSGHGGRRRRRGRGRGRRREREHEGVGHRAIRRSRQRDPKAHEAARKAVQNGEVRPLRDVFELVRVRGRAEILDVDLYRKEEKWVYAIRVLTRMGQIHDVILDAKTLLPLQID
jgi:hypothetical protein